MIKISITLKAPFCHPFSIMERVARIELANKPWQGFRLPLHHTRFV